MNFLEHVSLAPYTTFGIGGPTRYFAEATGEADVAAAVVFARDRALPLFVLGGGSNLLVADQGFPGLVLRMALRGITYHDDTFTAAAGEDWDAFVAATVAEDCAGMECLSGIPGTVGGTPVQNVGAYGQEVSQTITEVRAYDREQAVWVDLPASACAFAYRSSLFNSTARGRYLVTRVTYRLRAHGAPSFAYSDLTKLFAASEPTLQQVRDAVLGIRRAKGMLIVKGDADSRSAGSFFKNPVVPADTVAALADTLNVEPAVIPAYPAQPGQVKLSAAWLIDRAGFPRGYALGRAGISSRHTLALINRGGATAADILALRDHITAVVQDRFQVALEPEPVWLG